MTARRTLIADSLGVGLATGAYGISFGAISTASGLSVLQTCVVSFLVFTGASPFAFIGVLASADTPVVVDAPLVGLDVAAMARHI